MPDPRRTSQRRGDPTSRSFKTFGRFSYLV
jgi:hypothetical protein